MKGFGLGAKKAKVGRASSGRVGGGICQEDWSTGKEPEVEITQMWVNKRKS